MRLQIPVESFSSIAKNKIAFNRTGSERLYILIRLIVMDNDSGTKIMDNKDINESTGSRFSVYQRIFPTV